MENICTVHHPIITSMYIHLHVPAFSSLLFCLLHVGKNNSSVSFLLSQSTSELFMIANMGKQENANETLKLYMYMYICNNIGLVCPLATQR